MRTLTGLIKSVLIEFFYLRGHKGLRAVAIDAPDGEPPESFAESVYKEVTSRAIDFEVGYSGGRRQLPYAYPQPASLEDRAEIRLGARGLSLAAARHYGDLGSTWSPLRLRI